MKYIYIKRPREIYFKRFMKKKKNKTCFNQEKKNKNPNMIFTSLFYYIQSGCVAYGDQNKAVRHHSKNTLRMSHEKALLECSWLTSRLTK